MIGKLLIGFVAFPFLCHFIYPEYPVIAWFIIAAGITVWYEWRRKIGNQYPIDFGE